MGVGGTGGVMEGDEGARSGWLVAFPLFVDLGLGEFGWERWVCRGYGSG